MIAGLPCLLFPLNKEGPHMTESKATSTYDRALVIAAVLEIELVGQASSLDPESENRELMAQTSLAITTMEAFIATLFEISIEQVHEDIAQLDPQTVKQMMQNLAIMHAKRN